VTGHLWVREETPARRLALSPLLLLEAPYRLGAWLHRGAYRWGLRERVRLPVRVISVGNLSVGGSGKTPFTGWLARQLRARGRKVAILSRGVGGSRSADVTVVSDGERVLASPAEAGDEPVLLAGECPGVPVLAGRNRVALGHRAAAVFGAELVLLDDGFQHHRLHRDVDLVCIDSGTALGNGHVLPRGPLRESPGALRFADAFVWTRSEGAPPPAPWLPAGAPQFRANMAARGLRRPGAEHLEPLEFLRDRDVGVVAAIARPDRLADTLRAHGARVREIVQFPDHHGYRPRDLEALSPDHLWVTTAKDAVKLPPRWRREREVVVLEEAVDSPDAPALLEWLLARLHSAGVRK